ncbi:hypothetical protein RRG08_002117 [Elysia crispata]|uniref:Uncharacterized protein n=1 Tax=Elysia crispata TaxID=231223 RepID=A0AAE0XQQ2_9GAST|nr:hypothetical protein RRG08_002117 [Elysia crispata]
MSVNLTCFTGRVFPAAKCSFEMKRDSGMFVPLTAQPSYSHAATGESPVHYSSGCSVIVPVGDLGEGTLRFRGFIYPDVTGGKSLVNATGIAESLTLALPRASHSCPPSMVEDYLCGKSSVCNCTLVSPGNPRGRAVWYMPDTARPLTADGAMVVTYDINKPAPHYTCEGVSALGRKFGSSLKFSTETQCG